MTPKIGIIRLYRPGETQVVYPGEQASDEFRTVAGVRVHVSTIVEPEPGLRGAVRRACYRLVGRWLEKVGIGRPRTEEQR